ncbi:transposase [Streptomyces kebangsaanensis]|uniref:Transposase n=1 Tax=Streptomyces kebangsaanensis TaxID=864058 RepID=A0ABW6L5J9_9ACTN
MARLARHLLERCHHLILGIHSLDAEIKELVSQAVPSLLKIPGCGTPNAAKILGETAGIGRFRTKSACARHNGTAPLPVRSGNRERHRLARTGNRPLNAAPHRIAITQAHYHPDARAHLQRRKEGGNSTTGAIRALRRRLSDVVHRALLNCCGGGRQSSLGPSARGRTKPVPSTIAAIAAMIRPPRARR